VKIKAGTGRAGRTGFVRFSFGRLGSGLEGARCLEISRAVNIHARNRGVRDTYDRRPSSEVLSQLVRNFRNQERRKSPWLKVQRER